MRVTFVPSTQPMALPPTDPMAHPTTPPPTRPTNPPPTLPVVHPPPPHPAPPISMLVPPPCPSPPPYYCDLTTHEPPPHHTTPLTSYIVRDRGISARLEQELQACLMALICRPVQGGVPILREEWRWRKGRVRRVKGCGLGGGREGGVDVWDRSVNHEYVCFNGSL